MKRAAWLISVILTFGVIAPLGADDDPPVTLESLLTPEQQKSLNIAAMSSERREALHQALIGAFKAGFQRGKQEAQKSLSAPAAAVAATSAAPNGGPIESQIDGDFEGWEGETIVKLMNGQIWQQSEYHYEYHYAFGPKVIIYRSGGRWKMKVDGTREAVGVTQLR